MASTPLLALTLKQLRLQHNYTQKYVSHYLKMSRGGYAQYEADGRTPSLDILLKLSELYNITIDALVNRNTIPDTEPQKIPVSDNVMQEKCSYHSQDLMDHILQLGDLFLQAKPDIVLRELTQEDIDFLSIYKRMNKEQQKDICFFCKYLAEK